MHLTAFSCKATPCSLLGWDLEPLCRHNKAAEPTTPHLNVCRMLASQLVLRTAISLQGAGLWVGIST